MKSQKKLESAERQKFIDSVCGMTVKHETVARSKKFFEKGVDSLLDYRVYTYLMLFKGAILDRES